MTKPLHPFFFSVSEMARHSRTKIQEKDAYDEYDVKLSDLAKNMGNIADVNRRRKKVPRINNVLPRKRNENTFSEDPSSKAKPETRMNSTMPLSELVEITGAIDDVNRRQSRAPHNKNVLPQKRSGNSVFEDPSSKAKPEMTMNSTTSLKESKGLAQHLNKGIMHQLWSRSTNPRNQSQHIKAVKTPSWLPCPWLRLPVTKTGTVTCMAFDVEGVLLAAAMQSGQILIWDWDIAIASDFQGRRDGQIDVLNPVLQMRVPHLVSNMEWSDGDFLLTSFREAPELHLYDMGLISQQGSSLSLASYCTKLQPPNLVRSSQGPKCISFLPGYEHVVACYPCGYVCCWKIASRKLLWTWKSNEIISCIHAIKATNLILLGGVQGGFAIIDWQNTTRKAFSSEMTPLILSVWKTYPWFFHNKYCIQDCNLGVEAMMLETPLLQKSIIQSTNQIGVCGLTWVTSGGWMLRTNLKDTARLSIEILQKPPHLKTLTTEGKSVADERFSTPSKAVLSTSSSDSLMMLQVPQTTHILPHHDKRVCQSRQVVTDGSIRLGFISRYAPETQHIALKKPFTALCLHPTQSWMITAYKNRLGVWSARSAPARCES